MRTEYFFFMKGIACLSTIKSIFYLLRYSAIYIFHSCRIYSFICIASCLAPLLPIIIIMLASTRSKIGRFASIIYNMSISLRRRNSIGKFLTVAFSRPFRHFRTGQFPGEGDHTYTLEKGTNILTYRVS